ncbi:MAG: FAD:protein FMN transferase [Mycobacteriales bacterium]
MATRVQVYVADADPDRWWPEVRSALTVFHEVEAECSRFREDSALSRANREPGRWHEVPQWCLLALDEARQAYERTGGLFDPRVVGDLERLGYATSWPAGGLPDRAKGTAVQHEPLPAWVPSFDRVNGRANLGGHPVDLGGIGKGLAVRWAAQRLSGAAAAVLIDAGGDCMACGSGPDGTGWRVGVELPAAPGEHVAVLTVSDAAVCTSSVRVRRWWYAGRPVHHLIDPRTGEPGGAGLDAVTVVGRDPAAAEVAAKCLFLTGSKGVAAAAEAAGTAALWVHSDGSWGYSRELLHSLRWVRS